MVMNAKINKKNVGASNYKLERTQITPNDGALMRKTISISNALAINMLPFGGELKITPVTLEDVRKITSDKVVKSFVGHSATARLLSSLLGVEVPANREMFQFDWENNTLIVFSMMTRLPEGRELTEAEIKDLYNKGLLKFYVVELESDYA